MCSEWHFRGVDIILGLFAIIVKWIRLRSYSRLLPWRCPLWLYLRWRGLTIALRWVAVIFHTRSHIVETYQVLFVENSWLQVVNPTFPQIFIGNVSVVLTGTFVHLGSGWVLYGSIFTISGFPNALLALEVARLRVTSVSQNWLQVHELLVFILFDVVDIVLALLHLLIVYLEAALPLVIVSGLDGLP